MDQTKKQMQKEMYQFIEDRYLETDEPITQKEVVDHFCKANGGLYEISNSTIINYLAALTKRRNPFRLRSWHDIQRFYTVPAISAATAKITAAAIVCVFGSMTLFLFIIIPLSWMIDGFIIAFGMILYLIVKDKQQENPKHI